MYYFWALLRQGSAYALLRAEMLRGRIADSGSVSYSTQCLVVSSVFGVFSAWLGIRTEDHTNICRVLRLQHEDQPFLAELPQRRKNSVVTGRRAMSAMRKQKSRLPPDALSPGLREREMILRERPGAWVSHSRLRPMGPSRSAPKRAGAHAGSGITLRGGVTSGCHLGALEH
ncbi:hypothetical protein BDZ91DRAFT_231831 [Kalaharituber pfeilii]|nr:hypothetical protein BDZ91DRAFT_231831 [Kalaharituber pfeilii]